MVAVNKSSSSLGGECAAGLAKTDCHGPCPKPELPVDPAYPIHNSLNPLILDSVNGMVREWKYVTLVQDVIDRFVGFSSGAYPVQADCVEGESFDGTFCRTLISTCVQREVWIVDDDDSVTYTGNTLPAGTLLTPTLQGGAVSNDLLAVTEDPAVAVAVTVKQAPVQCGSCETPICPTADPAPAADGASPTAALTAVAQSAPLKACATFRTTVDVGGKCCAPPIPPAE